MAERKNGSQFDNGAGPGADASPAFSRTRLRIYQITVKGRLASDWSGWLGGLLVTHLQCGDTVLSGTAVDQAALLGLLNKLNGLNVTLLSVSQVEMTD